jgi:hypothetical protein
VFRDISGDVTGQISNVQDGEAVEPRKMEETLELLDRANLSVSIENLEPLGSREGLQAVGERFEAALIQCTDPQVTVVMRCSNP